MIMYYPYCQCDDPEPHYQLGAGLYRWRVDDLAREKRFTDAELSAEYWREHGEYQDTKEWAGRYEVIVTARDRFDTVDRFAMTPSYNEGDR